MIILIFNVFIALTDLFRAFYLFFFLICYMHNNQTKMVVFSFVISLLKYVLQ